MNRRLAMKKALLSTGRFPRPIPVDGLFDRTGSVALAVGAFRPRLLVDPRLFGENRVLRQFAVWHEGFHVILGHLRWLFVLKWIGIVTVSGLFGLLGCATLSAWGVGSGFFIGAWIEARYGFTTIDYRARAEKEADAGALSVMIPHQFASAVTALFSVTKPRSGIHGYIDRRVNCATPAERLARVGINVEAP